MSKLAFLNTSYIFFITTSLNTFFTYGPMWCLLAFTEQRNKSLLLSIFYVLPSISKHLFLQCLTKVHLNFMNVAVPHPLIKNLMLKYEMTKRMF